MKYFIPLILLLASGSVYGQSIVCPYLSLTKTNNVDTIYNHRDTIHCGNPCETLHAIPSTNFYPTTSYSVGPTAYTPYSFTAGTNAPCTICGGLLTSWDDEFGDVVPLPFPFCFWGTTYNNVVIGTNGNITFNTGLNNTYDNWPISGPIPGSNCNATFQAVMAPWNDLYPPSGGTIKYAVYGTAPCRQFVVSWNAVPLFNTGICPGMSSTQQLVLYESSNVIDINIANRVSCTAWNNGYAVTGIENPAGTSFVTAPGENGTTFTATNQAWRFTPNGGGGGGPAPWTYTWYDSTRTTVLGTSDSLTVCPTVDSWYYVKATSAACAGVVIWDSVKMIFGGRGIGHIDSVAQTNPSSCISSNGSLLFHGMPPGDSVIVTYMYNGVPVGPLVEYPNSDSDIIFSSLPAGVYANFYFKHDSCLVGPLGPYTLIAPPISITAEDSSNPTQCGLCDGWIKLHGLLAGLPVTVTWSLGTTTHSYTGVVALDSTVTLTGLCAGYYNNIVAAIGSCTTTGTPINLVNPVLRVSYETSSDPTVCGECNGFFKLHGLHPASPFTLSYSDNGVPQTPVFANVAPDSTISVINLCAGNYTGITVNIYGCTAPAPNDTIKNPPPIPASFTDSVILGCQGDKVILNNTSTPSGFTTLWRLGDGTTGYTPSLTHTFVDTPGYTGTYTITLIYSSYSNPACVDSVSKTVSFNHPISAAVSSNKDTVCLGDTITFNGATVSSYGPTYHWDFGNGVTSTMQNPAYAYPVAGDYIAQLIVTDSIGCSATTWENTRVVSVSVHTGTPDTSVCLHDSLALHAFVTIKPDNTIPFVYSWTQWPANIANVLGYDSSANPNFFSIGTFVFTVTATTVYQTSPDLLNCVATDTERVVSYPKVTLINVTPDATVAYGSSIQLNADGANIYTWTPNDGTLDNPNINNPVATPVDTVTVYTVQGMNLYGCLDTAQVTIRVDDAMAETMPTAFTPNGDGLNDFFRLAPKMKYQKLVQFSIFNRWGQKVFSTSDKNQGWDGTFNGVQQDMGVYHYEIIIAHPDGADKIYKGDVTLIR